MKSVKLSATLVSLSLSAVANAAVTSTWTLASDYDFRGITQSAQDPAVQASVDYVHDSGWYIGGWASNIEFCAEGNSSCLDADYEVDLYTGFSGSTGEGGLGWDVGLIYYTYEESDYNYPEIYASLSKDWFKGKVWYSNDFGGDTTAGDTPAFYVCARQGALIWRCKSSTQPTWASVSGRQRCLGRPGIGRKPEAKRWRDEQEADRGVIVG